MLAKKKDAFGLSKLNGRDRGIDSNFLSVNLEDVPNYSIRPIGARENIYDLENFSYIEKYSGAISSKSGVGVGNKGGVVNLKFSPISDKFSTNFSVSGGSDNFYKAFLRVDTPIDESNKIFISTSQSNSSKWKRYGDLGEQNNIAVGFQNDKQKLDSYFIHNTQTSHSFKGLSHKESLDLSKNYKLDYQNTDNTKANFYDYWKEDNSYDEFQIGKGFDCFNSDCKAKFYASKTLEIAHEGDGRATVDGKRVGVILSNTMQLNQFDIESGLWGELSWLDKYVQKVSTTPQRTDQGWKWLNENDGASSVISPYISSSYMSEYFKFEGGLKYVRYLEAGNRLFENSNKFSNFNDAINHGKVVAGGVIDDTTYNILLPSFGIRYTLDFSTELFFKYSKTFQRPYRYSFFAQYSANKNGIQDNILNSGKTLNDIFKSWDIRDIKHV
ncbi:MAG: TonB-dependent receptor [Campylobacterales bacterium]|nr:TonB-dependent receptor [Campylobacterales bacterium]